MTIKKIYNKIELKVIVFLINIWLKYQLLKLFIKKNRSR